MTMMTMVTISGCSRQDPHHGPHIHSLNPANRRAHNDAFEGSDGTAFKVRETML
jgi:hypothetical protein